MDPELDFGCTVVSLSLSALIDEGRQQIRGRVDGCRESTDTRHLYHSDGDDREP